MLTVQVSLDADYSKKRNIEQLQIVYLLYTSIPNTHKVAAFNVLTT